MIFSLKPDKLKIKSILIEPNKNKYSNSMMVKFY